MAAYAATVTSPLRKPIKIGHGVGIYYGQINLSNYNTTLAEITDITGKFNDKKPVVTVSGISENGYLCHWDPTAKAVKAFYPVKAQSAHSHTITVNAGTTGDAVTNNAGTLESTGGQDLTTQTGGAITAAAGTEVANDVDVGLVYFQAVGMMKG